MAKSISLDASANATRKNLSPGAKSSRFLNEQEKEDKKTLLSEINHSMHVVVFFKVKKGNENFLLPVANINGKRSLLMDYENL